MQLYLIRHGIAVERSLAFSDDALRPLSLRGTDNMRQEAEGLRALGVSPDVILTSPLVRARQTAEVLVEGLDVREGLVEAEALAPAGGLSTVLELLAAEPARRQVVLVGHEPGIGELAARLVGLRAPMAFKKGAVCRVDLDVVPPTGPGSLRWFATPKMLRRLATLPLGREPVVATR